MTAYATAIDAASELRLHSPADLDAYTQKARVPGFGHCKLCDPFLSIEPLIRTRNGTSINPLFYAVKTFRLAASPFPVSQLPAGQTVDIAFTVQAEENSMGDLLVSEILATTKPNGGRFALFLQSRQNDKLFMNVPVLDRLVASNAQIKNKLPSCTFIQATNFIQGRVTNLETFPIDIRMALRGRHFLPYQNPELREQILAYWNANRSQPYNLAIDLVQSPTATLFALSGGGVQIPAGATATVFMTVPGSGVFEAQNWVCAVYGVSGPVDAGDILCDIKEGVGRSIMSQPLPLGDFLAQPNSFVANLQGGEWRAGSGSHGEEFSQFFKRNTRIRVTLQNTANFTAQVFLGNRGTMHFYDECPPGDAMSRALSLEPVVGPMLMEQPPCPPIMTFQPVAGYGMQPTQPGPVYHVPPTGIYLPGATPPPVTNMAGMGAFRQGGQVQRADGGRPYGGRW